MSTCTRLLVFGALAALGGTALAENSDNPPVPGQERASGNLTLSLRLIPDLLEPEEDESSALPKDAEIAQPPDFSIEEEIRAEQERYQPRTERASDVQPAEVPEGGSASGADESTAEPAPGGETEPGLAQQRTPEEAREGVMSRAEETLNRVDQILLDARAAARAAREEAAAGGGEGGGSDSGEGESAAEEDSMGGRADAEMEDGELEEDSHGSEVAEGQVAGNTPTGKSRPAHGYEHEDDIVTRQICELAEKEQDPDVKKSLREKCTSMRNQ